MIHDVVSKNHRIYLDANATTPIYKGALEGMVDAYKTKWGNPGGPYYEGAVAKKTLEWSRSVFATHMDVAPETIYFTSCGTETNNIVIRAVMGDCANAGGRKDIIVTTAVEHSSIRKTAEMCGYKHIQVPVDRKGYVIMEEFRNILRSNRSHIGLVSIIMGQNEVGTIQNISALVKITRELLGPNVPFHTDATQMMGKYYIHPRKLGIDLLTGSAHKFHGPRGVGILYSREGVIKPSATTMTGGGQERGCRSGTENVPAIYGAAIAFDYMLGDVGKWESRVARILTLRNTMMESLRRSVPGLIINGDPQRGLYNTLSVSFPDGHGHAICDYANKLGVAIGAGSACSKGKPSESLLAMFGESEMARKVVHGTVRISLSHLNTESQCAQAADVIVRAWRTTQQEIAEAKKKMERATEHEQQQRKRF